MKARSLLGLLVVLGLFGSGARAEQVTLLTHGDEALAARLKAVSQARESIDLATYVFKPCDSSTKLLLKAMFKKSAQGVKVRAVLDAFLLTQEERANIQELFRRNKAQLKYFNNAHLVLNANNRSHVKTLVIDGRLPNRTYFVGGRNVTDEYYGLSAKSNLIDQDLMIKGASGSAAQASFDELWSSRLLSQVPPAGYITFPKFQESCLKATERDQQVATYFRDESERLIARAPRHECSSVRYAMDAADFRDAKYGQRRDHEDGGLMNPDRMERKRMTKMFLDFIRKAKSSLTLENQYYLPTTSIHEIFEDLRDKKVRVTVLANRKSDALGGMDAAMTTAMITAAIHDTKGTQFVVPVSNLGALNDRHPLSYPDATWRIHTKSGVRDDKDVLISSYNIDPRSFHTNLESGVIVNNCPALARDVQKHFDSTLKTVRADQIACGACREETHEIGFLTHLKSFLAHEYF